PAAVLDIDQERERIDACEQWEVLDVSSIACRPCWTQQCAAMLHSRGCGERSLDALAEHQAVFYGLIRPQPDHAASGRAAGHAVNSFRLWADSGAMDRLWLAHDRVGPERDHAGRAALFPRAARVPAQNLHHVIRQFGNVDAASDQIPFG